MMVVSNTSPMTSQAAISQLDLLRPHNGIYRYGNRVCLPGC